MTDIGSITVRVLGAVQAECEGEPVDLGGPRQRAVLAQLLCARGDVVPVDRLIDQLWPSKVPRSAANALQVYISNLRRALEPDRPARTPARLLVSTPPGYALRLPTDSVDAWRFEHLLEAAEAEGNTAGKRGILCTALGLWAGPALAEFADQPWAEAECARLRELHFRARRNYVAALLGTGAHTDAMVAAQELVHDDHLREEPWRLLALSQYLDGRQADALATLRRVRAVLADELGVDPGPALQQLEQAVLNQTVEPEHHTVPVVTSRRRAAPGRASPPHPSAPLIGREREMTQLADLINGPYTRLLTITGAGGAGKTRLAMEVVAALAAGFETTWFVALHSARTADQMWTTIADTVAVQPPPADEFGPRVIDALSKAGRSLLVLDNLEQIDDADSVLGQLIAGATEVVLLATSRRPLLIAGERVLQLDPLGLPSDDSAQSVIDSAAGQMFAEFARMTKQSFTVTEANAAAVAALCRRLDGLPLALELAASQSRIFSPSAILERLTPRLGRNFTAADRPQRQRTLSDTIAWSYDLLDDIDKRTLRIASVFRRSFDLDAIASVVTGADEDPDAAIDSVSRLITANLAYVVPTETDQVRIGMLETIHEYATELLDADPDADVIRGRHLRWCAAVVHAARPHIGRPQHQRALAAMGAVEKDAIAAVEWVLGSPGRNSFDVDVAGQISVDLAGYWAQCRTTPDALRILEQAVAARAGAMDGLMREQLTALIGLSGQSSGVTPRLKHARTLLSVGRALGGEHLVRALNAVGIAQMDEGESAAAEASFRESLELARGLSSATVQANPLGNLAFLFLEMGRYAAALDASETALRFAETHDLTWHVQQERYTHVVAHLNLGEVDRARRELAAWADDILAVKDTILTAATLDAAAAIAAACGDVELARTALSHSDALREATATHRGTTQNWKHVAQWLDPVRNATAPEAVAALSASPAEVEPASYVDVLHRVAQLAPQRSSASEPRYD